MRYFSLLAGWQFRDFRVSGEFKRKPHRIITRTKSLLSGTEEQSLLSGRTVQTKLGEEPRSFLICRLAKTTKGHNSMAINNGVPERLVGKHGRWKSGYSKDRYNHNRV